MSYTRLFIIFAIIFITLLVNYEMWIYDYLNPQQECIVWRINYSEAGLMNGAECILYD